MTKPQLSKSAKFWFAVALALQVGILVSFHFAKQSALANGKHIMAAVRPVDPRDLFRGDYVRLDYAFSSVPKRMVKFRVHPGRDLYVKMASQPQAASALAAGQAAVFGLAWVPVAVSYKPFKVGPDEIMMRGTVANESYDALRLNYGIESYYVPEGQGRPIEAAIRQYQVDAEIALSPKGEATLAGLYIDRQPVAFK